jgi:OPT oligopeptide transporter protein
MNPVSLYLKPSFDLNEESYQKQAPIYITSYFAVCYTMSFIGIAAAFSHVFLWHGDDIWKKMKQSLSQIDSLEEDLHCHLMNTYPKIPDSVFLFSLGMLVLFHLWISQYTAFHMPVWAVLLCISLAVVSVLPIGFITAITGQRLHVNVISEFIIGLLIPGQTIPGILKLNKLWHLKRSERTP